VLAYVGARGAVNVIVADTRRKLASWREGAPRELTWSPDGRYLIARSSGLISVYTAAGIRVTGISTRSIGTIPSSIPSLAFAPRGNTFAFVARDLDRNRSSVYVESLGGRGGGARERRVFTGAGRFTSVRWSPDGRWLLVAWRDADQWLFIRSAGVKRIVAVSDVSRQFGGTFPELAGWCCS
jgi:Tol biopolymer transport system component